MSHSCDGLGRIKYTMRYGHDQQSGVIVLPNKPYGECCLKLKDLAREAKQEFNVPLHSMKLTWNHKPIMTDYATEKDTKMSSIGIKKDTSKFNIYGGQDECCTESKSMQTLQGFEWTYRELTRDITNLLLDVQHLQNRQNQAAYSQYCGQIFQSLWSQLERKAVKLATSLRAILKEMKTLKFHPANQTEAEKRTIVLSKKCVQASAQSDLVIELANQVFVKCHLPCRKYVNATQLW